MWLCEAKALRHFGVGLSPMCLAAWSYRFVFLAFRPALALLPRVWFLAARVLVCWRCRDIYVVMYCLQ